MVDVEGVCFLILENSVKSGKGELVMFRRNLGRGGLFLLDRWFCLVMLIMKWNIMFFIFSSFFSVLRLYFCFLERIYCFLVLCRKVIFMGGWYYCLGMIFIRLFLVKYFRDSFVWFFVLWLNLFIRMI